MEFCGELLVGMDRYDPTSDFGDIQMDINQSQGKNFEYQPHNVVDGDNRNILNFIFKIVCSFFCSFSLPYRIEFKLNINIYLNIIMVQNIQKHLQKKLETKKIKPSFCKIFLFAMYYKKSGKFRSKVFRISTVL